MDIVPNELPNSIETIPLCVVLSRKDIQSQWTDYAWEPIGVVLDVPRGVHGKVQLEGDGWVHYLLECDPLELHRKDAPAYREGLGREDNALLWVVLGEEADPDSPLPYYVQLVTASPYEAQDYLDSGELIVEAVDMPNLLRLHIEDYVARCPEEEEFIKRKQKKKYSDDHSFGQQSLHEIRDLKKRGH